MGYVDNPSAIYTRGLAHGLALRGNDIRIVEERQNQSFSRTLREVGAGAARHFYDSFPMIQHNTYEGRRGGQLLEWVTREIALIDVAVAVAGLDHELCRWLANISQPGLIRAFLTFTPETLTDDSAAALEIGRFDLLLAPAQPAAQLAWLPVSLAVADLDRSSEIVSSSGVSLMHTDSIQAAESFEAVIARTNLTSGR